MQTVVPQHAVGVDDRKMRDAADVVVGVEDLGRRERDRPGDLHRLDVLGHQRVLLGGIALAVDRLLAARIVPSLQARDAEDHDVLGRVVLAKLPHVREARDARAAPGRPEVEHHDLAAKVLERGDRDRSVRVVHPVEGDRRRGLIDDRPLHRAALETGDRTLELLRAEMVAGLGRGVDGRLCLREQRLPQCFARLRADRAQIDEHLHVAGRAKHAFEGRLELPPDEIELRRVGRERRLVHVPEPRRERECAAGREELVETGMVDEGRHRDAVDLEAHRREARLEAVRIGGFEERREASFRLLLQGGRHGVPERLQLGRRGGVEIDGELRPDRLADRTKLLLELRHQFRGHRAAVVGEELLVRGAGLGEPRLADRLHGLFADARGRGVLSLDRSRGGECKHCGRKQAGGERTAAGQAGEVREAGHGDPSIEGGLPGRSLWEGGVVGTGGKVPAGCVADATAFRAETRTAPTSPTFAFRANALTSSRRGRWTGVDRGGAAASTAGAPRRDASASHGEPASRFPLERRHP